MKTEDISEGLTYADKEPDITSLRYAYDQTVIELEAYFDLCRNSYDDRRNWWPGKSRDLRKHGADAFPWEGAADMESHVIDERITRLVSIFMTAMNRAQIKAYPVNSTEIDRAKVVSSFLKWMTTSGYIDRFKREMELGANYMLERGLMITYVGWNREDRSYLQKLDLDQIGQISPDLVESITSGENDEEVISLMQTAMPNLKRRRAKKALRQLRKNGVAELPIVRRQVDAPMVKTLAPDGDFFFPAYVTDPQRAPYCFWRTYYTVQELKNKVATDDWDEEWVDHVIEHYKGVNIDSIEREQEGRRSISLTDNAYEAEELIEVIHGYQRLIDREDNSEGIYETVFHREFDGDEGMNLKGFAKFELMNGYEDYPVVVTRLSEDSKRLYDTGTIPDVLRGIQMQVKVERDARIDQNSMATLPPLMHPPGNVPSEWGPGRMLVQRRKGEFEFGPQPAYNEGSLEMEQTQQEQADKLVGLDESPFAQLRRQFLVDKFLYHVAEVLKMAFRAFQRFGPDSIYFQVTGVQDPLQFDKGNPDENFDINISWNVQETDPEFHERKLQMFTSLLQFDRNGKIDVDTLLSLIGGSIDPVLADAILQPGQTAQEQIAKQVTDDLAKIFSGIEMPARPNGGQIALQIIQQYTQQPDVQQQLQENEAFRARLEKYAQQYQFALQQMQNAEIGRIGTQPAQMGSVNTQRMGQ